MNQDNTDECDKKEEDEISKLPLSMICTADKLHIIIQNLASKCKISLIINIVFLIIQISLLISSIGLYFSYKKSCISIKLFWEITISIACYESIFITFITCLSYINWRHCKHLITEKIKRKKKLNTYKPTYETNKSNFKNVISVIKSGEGIARRCLAEESLNNLAISCKSEKINLQKVSPDEITDTLYKIRKQWKTTRDSKNYTHMSNTIPNHSKIISLITITYILPIVGMFSWLFCIEIENIDKICKIPFVYFWFITIIMCLLYGIQLIPLSIYIIQK